MAEICKNPVDAAQKEKCKRLNELVAKYKTDFAKLQQQNGSNGVFTDVMTVNQFRDANWQENYPITDQQNSIKKIADNLNKIVTQMGGEYGLGSKILREKALVDDKYTKLNKLLEDELVEHEQRVDAAQDKIILRNRLVRFNEDDAQLKGQIIHFLSMFFFAALFMIPVWVAFMAGALSGAEMFGCFIMIVMVYLVYVFIQIFYTDKRTGKNTLSSTLEKDWRDINRRFLHFGRDVNREFNKSIQSTCSFSPSGLATWDAGGRGYVPA